MVDKEPGAYRPRRAFSDEPDEPNAASPTAPVGDASGASVGSPLDRTDAQLDPQLDDEAPKPLYRDEVPGDGTSASAESVDETRVRQAPKAVDRDPDDGPRTSEQTQILSRARARAKGGSRPTGHRRRDEDATTILPRTAAGARIERPDDARGDGGDHEDDDLRDDADDRPGGQRSKLGLLIAAVAGVIVLGLAVGYTVFSLTRPSAAPGVPPAAPAAPAAPTGQSGAPAEPDATALLSDASLLTPQSAAKIDSDRTWKVQLTQKGQSADSPQPACLGGEPGEGQPIPQQSMLRVLTSSGQRPPAVLQQADAYASPEEAAQAYAVASRTLGGCTMAATYLESGASVSRLGDQSLGVIFRVTEGGASEYRTVILSRTGRVVDAVDVAQPAEAVPVGQAAVAAADVVNAQCKTAGGACASGVQVKPAPPPVGGDAPGFLATADLPPVGAVGWVANKPATPDSDMLKGSGCENVDWAKQSAVTRAWRTYLLQDSPSRFGLDEVVLTLKSPADATKLAEKIRDDWSSCGRRQLTATVRPTDQVTATGAQNTKIEGWTTSVQQKAGNATSSFRVGIAAAGPKVVFTFLNPQDKLDLSAAQFADVTGRAGQRATQTR
jgi:hypothetical protein